MNAQETKSIDALNAATEADCVLVPSKLYARLLDMLSKVPASAVSDVATSKGWAVSVVIHEDWYAERVALLAALPKVTP